MAQEMEMNNSISFYSCHGYRLTVEINQTVNHRGRDTSSEVENLPSMYKKGPVFDFQHHKNVNHLF